MRRHLPAPVRDPLQDRTAADNTRSSAGATYNRHTSSDMTFSAENLAAFDMIKSIPAEDLNACVAAHRYSTALSPGQPAERRLLKAKQKS